VPTLLKVTFRPLTECCIPTIDLAQPLQHILKDIFSRRVDFRNLEA